MPENLLRRVIRALMPRGSAWRWRGHGDKLLDGLAAEPQRLKDFHRRIVEESFPETAVDTLPEWYEMLGLPYDPALPLEDRQAIAAQKHIAVGSQDIHYLNRTIRTAHPDLTISKVAPDGHKFYRVTGYTPPAILDQAEAILQRVAPAEMEPLIDVITFQRVTTDGAVRVTKDGAIRGGR